MHIYIHIYICVHICVHMSVCVQFFQDVAVMHCLYHAHLWTSLSMISCQMNSWGNRYSLYFHLLASGWGTIIFTLFQLFLRTAGISETWRSWENLQIWNPQYFHISKQEISLKWDLCVHLGENTKISSRWGASIFLTLYMNWGHLVFKWINESSLVPHKFYNVLQKFSVIFL